MDEGGGYYVRKVLVGRQCFRPIEVQLRYADLGYRVFPCIPDTKLPLTEHGFLDASTEQAQLTLPSEILQ